jgi:hypothetical protein
MAVVAIAKVEMNFILFLGIKRLGFYSRFLIWLMKTLLLD